MSATEAKVRCPKCHFRFFVPFDEIGRDHTTPCPNCATSIPVKTALANLVDAGNVQQAVAPPVAPRGRETPVVEPLAAAIADVAEMPAPRPWWKFWAR